MNRIGHAALVLPVLALAACSGSSGTVVQGYVEGTYVYISRGCRRTPDGTAGIRPARGSPPATCCSRLTTPTRRQPVAGAEARLARGRGAARQPQDRASGRRRSACSSANLASARAVFLNAEDDYRRKLLLRGNGTIAQAAVDAAKATLRPQPRRSTPPRGSSRSPACRRGQSRSTRRNATSTPLQADLSQARTALTRRTLTAPAAALVEETYYEPGELVAAGQPVVSLLPDANRKIRFFLPERLLAGIAPGSEVGVSCDGCAGGLLAKVEFVATEAEFTPPILYSKDSRDKLVFGVDAVPDGEALTNSRSDSHSTSISSRRHDRSADHRGRGLDQELQRPGRRRSCRPDREPRRNRRLPRAERLGQDDDDPHALRPADARRRRGHLPRLRHPAPSPTRSSARSAT